MSSRYPILIALTLAGCSETAKPDPLPRAGVVFAAPVKKEVTPTPPNPVSATLFKRLGGEDGAMGIVAETLKILDEQAATKPLAAKLNKQALVDFLMYASSGPQAKLGDMLALSTADWSLLLPAVRSAMIERGITGDDRDELIANIEKSR